MDVMFNRDLLRHRYVRCRKHGDFLTTSTNFNGVIKIFYDRMYFLPAVSHIKNMNAIS